ncbi:MOSC domain-containing protein [Alkalihalobacillus sp. 1P02AB]|uniref:MOSC domain-containing protein n=1 Tax=Alkalihalobacillus sp. 1P02AB TaxID=3132260 RepID=UPI0039A62A23
MSITIEGIYVGKPREVMMNGKPVKTSIYKEPLFSTVQVNSLGIIGDTQSDLVHHGGVDMAICLYPAEHYSYWEEKLGRNPGQSAFGENLTVSGLSEQDVQIGDVYRIGDVLLEISQPRSPCYKIGLKHNEPKMALWVNEKGWSGYYARVLHDGEVSVGDELELVERHAKNPTVLDVNKARYWKEATSEDWQELVKVRQLSQEWREHFQKRLEKQK